MLNENKQQLFYVYYKQWIDVYKKGAIPEADAAAVPDENLHSSRFLLGYSTGICLPVGSAC